MVIFKNIIGNAVCCQIIDDILDFTGTSEALGKPAMADVSLVRLDFLSGSNSTFANDRLLFRFRRAGLSDRPRTICLSRVSRAAADY